ncbi:MAG: isocitrate lyase/phosphoenolpyruvate mutase family protein [Myxococcales bacterium]|nr:isocitrate lyase/phosphoenolpyruvate mutase family protein [Myxococcales bacterium]
MATRDEKAKALKQLHEGEQAFIVPNPWDAGSARLLEALGFRALATTSAGFAYTLGRRDGGVTLEDALAHCRALADATDVPVTADLENGFASSPDAVADTIRKAAQTGIVGGSIEDYDPEGDRIYDLGHAVERVQAAVEAARELPFPFALTARAEGRLRKNDDLNTVIKRLQAFQSAGADVLYAPGLTTLDEVRRVVEAVDRPVNVLASMLYPATVAELADAGARRISIGGALCYAAMSPILKAGKEMLNDGSFSWIETIVSPSELRDVLE